MASAQKADAKIKIVEVLHGHRLLTMLRNERGCGVDPRAKAGCSKGYQNCGGDEFDQNPIPLDEAPVGSHG